MKKTKIWLGMLVMALVFGMTVIGCDNGTTSGSGETPSGNQPGGNNQGGNNPGGNGGGAGNSGSSTLNLSGQVYTLDVDLDEMTATFERFTGNRTVYARGNVSPGGGGAITNGQLSFSIGTPYAGSLEEWMGEDTTTISPLAARFHDLTLRTQNGTLSRIGNIVLSGTEDVGTFTYTVVNYIFADRDATITDTGWEYDWGSEAQVLKPFTINLRTGWNIVIITMEYSWTRDTFTETIGGVSRVNYEPSGIRWELNEWSGFSANIMPMSSPQRPRRTFAELLTSRIQGLNVVVEQVY